MASDKKPDSKTDAAKAAVLSDKYRIEPHGNGKIAASLCKKCGPGGVGESLIRDGFSQNAFAAFCARLADEQLNAKKRSVAELTTVFELVSACNASAASKALEDCNLFDENVCIKDKEGKLQPMLVKTYWASHGGGKAAPNTSLLD